MIKYNLYFIWTYNKQQFFNTKLIRNVYRLKKFLSHVSYYKKVRISTWTFPRIIRRPNLHADRVSFSGSRSLPSLRENNLEFSLISFRIDIEKPEEALSEIFENVPPPWPAPYLSPGDFFQEKWKNCAEQEKWNFLARPENFSSCRNLISSRPMSLKCTLSLQFVSINPHGS